jgi:hypothetical protein
MSAITFIAMPTDVARAHQAGAPDANGQKPERHVSDGTGVPCRHCQRDVAADEPYLILAYRPFPRAQPYAEIGPVFLHAEPCDRYPVTGEMPAMFLKREHYLLKGYRGGHRRLSKPDEGSARGYQYFATGRTSIAPPRRAAGIWQATLTAASRSSASRQ